MEVLEHPNFLTFFSLNPGSSGALSEGLMVTRDSYDYYESYGMGRHSSPASYPEVCLHHVKWFASLADPLGIRTHCISTPSSFLKVASQFASPPAK